MKAPTRRADDWDAPPQRLDVREQVASEHKWWRSRDVPAVAYTDDERDQRVLWWQTYLWLAVNGYLRTVRPVLQAAAGGRVPVDLRGVCVAARVCKVDRATLYRAVSVGQLTTYVDDNRRKLSLAEVQSWNAQRPRLGSRRISQGN